MTKRVRVENADLANYKVRVKIFQKSNNPNAPDMLMDTQILDNPADLRELYITSSQYLVVEEYEDSVPCPTKGESMYVGVDQASKDMPDVTRNSRKADSTHVALIYVDQSIQVLDVEIQRPKPESIVVEIYLNDVETSELKLALYNGVSPLDYFNIR